MNRQALVCRNILEKPDITQREMAKNMDISLGTVNGLVKECLALHYIEVMDDNHYHVTEDGMKFMEPFKVDGAVIIAAGFGSRFVPLTFETPKGLLEVFGERMIERQIRQLHEVGIHNITIVVGYLKEKFEYLIDKYDVKLLYNPEYSNKNTLTTVYRARKVLGGKNMYLLSSDNWMRENMYHTYECGAWYSSVYKEGDTSEWSLSYNKKGRIQNVEIGGHDCYVMYGPVYMSSQWLSAFLPILEVYYTLPNTEQFYWENVMMELLNGTARKRIKEAGITNIGGQSADEVLSLAEHMEMDINRQPSDQVYEFENLEELRLFDESYQNHSHNQAMELISSVFQIPESEIHNIHCLKSGMTNKSFLFQVHGKSYICRVPGPGTGLLINRHQEGDVLEAVANLGITEHVIYFNRDTGYKITEYYENSRNADVHKESDMQQCMDLVTKLHQSGIQLKHSFDIRERIAFYENLCIKHGGIPFEDYEVVKDRMNTLMDHLDALNRPKTIAHIDSNVDNFLFLPNGDLKLIDWEYCGMCDPLIDVSMCAIYSYYNDFEVEKLITTYLHREPTSEERFVYYAYIALGGFLWCLWAVYKSSVGEEFGDYTIVMYRYAKQFYKKIITAPEFLGIGKAE